MAALLTTRGLERKSEMDRLQDQVIIVTGGAALGVGTSTGGFTDCLLQGGAQRVYAVHVGYIPSNSF